MIVASATRFFPGIACAEHGPLDQAQQEKMGQEEAVVSLYHICGEQIHVTGQLCAHRHTHHGRSRLNSRSCLDVHCANHTTLSAMFPLGSVDKSSFSDSEKVPFSAWHWQLN